jgi:hypothetical protein
MIPQQTFETFPVFSDTGTKVKPDDAKYSAGFQVNDVLPAEWMNWEWNKASKGVTDLNSGVTSVEGELNNILTEAEATPDGTKTDQVYKAVRKNCGCIMANSLNISSAPSIASNNVVKIMFTADIAAKDTTTGMVITYKGTNYSVWVCKDGSLIELKGHTISGSTKYLQANTVIELIFDGTKFIVIGNPVVLSGADYAIFANGQQLTDSVTDGDMSIVTSNAVYDYAVNKANVKDTVLNGDLNPVTGNAVYDYAVNKANVKDTVLNGDLNPVTGNAVYDFLYDKIQSVPVSGTTGSNSCLVVGYATLPTDAKILGLVGSGGNRFIGINNNGTNWEIAVAKEGVIGNGYGFALVTSKSVSGTVYFFR